MAKYECEVCGFIYDEEKEGTSWDQLPDNWACPVCGADKSQFKRLEDESTESVPESSAETTSSEKVVCKVCGYLMDAELYSHCPACGAPESAFEPYIDPISPKRRKILDFHLHSIMVHFPQAFAVFLMFLSTVIYLLSEPLKTQFISTLTVLAFFLPLTVAPAIISGIIDAKARFKRLDTILLKRKIIVALVFLVLSAGSFLFLFFRGFDSVSHLITLILTGLCVIASVFLGHTGGGLVGKETREHKV